MSFGYLLFNHASSNAISDQIYFLFPSPILPVMVLFIAFIFSEKLPFSCKTKLTKVCAVPVPVNIREVKYALWHLSKRGIGLEKR